MPRQPQRDRPPPREQRVCRAIRLLAAGHSAAEVAREVRVMPRTLAAWQSWDDFRALVDCLRASGQMRDAIDMLDALTPEAIEALQEALDGEDRWLAVTAAREVLKYVMRIQQVTGHVIRVEYVNPERNPVSTSPWADRHPPTPGAVQSGGLRSPLREDGDGQDSAD